MSLQITVQNIQQVVQQVKSCTDVIKEGASLCNTLTSLLRTLCCNGKSIPCVGGILAVVEGLLPDGDSEVVIRLLQNLSEQIKAVRHDISELENKIKLEGVKLQYCDIATKIETGMDYLSRILKSANDDERTRFEERLKELCSNQTMTLAVVNLVKGLAPEDNLLQNDILETIYRATRGHRGNLDSVCNRFQQLFAGGVAVILIYETLVRGEEAASEMNQLFEGHAEKLMKRFEEFRQKCKDCFRENMQSDLNEVIDGEMSNKDAVEYLSDFLRKKYDWLETYSIVCKESIFIDYDFTGDHVKSLERNDRFGVIFYREGRECPTLRRFRALMPRQVSRLSQVRQIIRETDKDCWFSDAARINSILGASLRRNGVCLWGCATVKAKRIISIPLINIPVIIKSNKALDCFEISGVWTEAVSDVGGHKHLCLLK